MIDHQNYFDWAATAIPDGDILEESLAIATEFFQNPSSSHRGGKGARGKLEEARARSAAALGVPPATVCFTSGGTEADHLPILSLFRRPTTRGTIAFSAVEHPAVREMAEAMRGAGWNIAAIPCDRRGIVGPEEVRQALTADTVLVCIMAVNNETGAVMDVGAIADVITEVYQGKRRPRLHVDCVQAAGKVPLDLAHPGIDSAALSAHKICGPRGVGLLYLAKPVEPFLRGGGQEAGYRSGTENLAGAWALSRCLERYFLRPETAAGARTQGAPAGDSAQGVPPPERYRKQRTMTAQFIDSLSSINTCTLIPRDRDDGRFSPYVLMASFAGIPGEVMLRCLDDRGFAISTGSACSSRRAGESHSVLQALGVPQEIAQNAVRFSFGHSTTAEDMKNLFGAVESVCREFSRP